MDMRMAVYTIHAHRHAHGHAHLEPLVLQRRLGRHAILAVGLEAHAYKVLGARMHLLPSHLSKVDTASRDGFVHVQIPLE